MQEFAAHYGQWGLVVIMVVIASWLLYRYAAPRSWREWSGAGLVQAFIIALYAEMYGFPLTIYLLTGFLGIDLPLTSYSGHLWATLLGYGEGGAMVEMLLGLAFQTIPHMRGAQRHAETFARRRAAPRVVLEATRRHRGDYLCRGCPRQLSLGAGTGTALCQYGELPCGLVALLCGEPGRWPEHRARPVPDGGPLLVAGTAL